MASDTIRKYCLICSTSISTEQTKVKNLDALFLIQILFEIPPNHQLINSIKSSTNLLQLCDKCIVTVHQCKQIYTEISEKIEKFWEIQNNILDHFNSNQQSSQITEDGSNTWATQCRKFVQHHDFAGFGYPFVIQDLETLLTSNQPPPLPQKLPPGITCTIARKTSSSSNSNEHSQNLTAKPLPSVTCVLTGETSSIGSPNGSEIFKNNSSLDGNELLYPSSKNVTISIVQDDSVDNSEEYKLSENLSSDELSDNIDSEREDSHEPKMIRIIIAPGSKASKPTQEYSQINNLRERQQNEYNFCVDPISGKFLCLDSSCSKSSVSKQYITNHYETDHLKIREKESFACDWSGCGKIIGDKQTWKEHMDKHRGTPSNECKICGDKFYYRKKLLLHKKRVHENNVAKNFGGTNEITLVRQCQRQVEEHELVRQQRKRVHVQDVTMVDQEIYRCEVPECKGRRFKDRLRLQNHIDQHNGTPREICGECGQRFYYRFHLDEHQQKSGHL